MPTTVSSTVGTTGTYASWAAWEAAAPANLVTADQIWEGQGQNQEFYEAGGVVTIGGQTTDSTRFMRMTTVSGASFADNANKLTNELRYNATNGCGLRSGNFVPTVFVGTAYTQITKLQIQASVNDTAIPATGSNVTIAQCIIQAGGRVISLEGGGTSLCTNTLFIRSANGGGHGIFFSYGVANVYNCAVIRPSNLTPGDNGIRNEGGTLTVKNTSVFGFSTFETGGTTGSNNNASDLATVPGSSPQASLTFTAQFEQSSAASALDLRTKTGSAQIANGADLSGSGVTVDIVGTARSAPYDIGVWQTASGTTYTLDAGAGTYSYTSSALSITTARGLSAGVQAYNYGAQPVSVNLGKALSPSALTYAYGAQPVVIVFSPSGGGFSPQAVWM